MNLLPSKVSCTLKFWPAGLAQATNGTDDKICLVDFALLGGDTPLLFGLTPDTPGDFDAKANVGLDVVGDSCINNVGLVKA